MLNKQLTQGTQEWLEWRRSKICASDAPSIMGVGFSTPYQVWEEKVLGKQKFVSHHMKRGKDLEESARREFERMIGVGVIPLCAESEELPWMAASFDGLDMDGKILVEIKIPSPDNYEKASQGIDERYYAQFQQQLKVSGLDGMYYFPFDGRQGKIIEVARDEKYIKKMIKEEEKFLKHMLSKEPPPYAEKDYVCMDDHPNVCSMMEKLSHLSKQKSQLEEEDKLIRKELEALANGQNIQAGKNKFTLIRKKGLVDYSKVPELKGVNLEVYRKDPISFWKFSS